ncbi:MAG: SDR family NAD(P)-dependent oxidoreductase, partial [Rhizobiales bacterium]|nr:SDR family NAD(P)-dependent oxidoreductase [Hyphomicrobiales bacterium]
MDYFDRKPYVVAVIGAASGIGKATAELLAGQGVTVACIDQHESGAKETASAIKKAGGKADAIAADVV